MDRENVDLRRGKHERDGDPNADVLVHHARSVERNLSYTGVHLRLAFPDTRYTASNVSTLSSTGALTLLFKAGNDVQGPCISPDPEEFSLDPRLRVVH